MLLYNCEVWSITETGKKSSVGKEWVSDEEVGGASSEEAGGQEIDGEPAAGDAWFGVDPVVDSQQKAAMGGSLCEEGGEGSHVEEGSERDRRWEK